MPIFGCSSLKFSIEYLLQAKKQLYEPKQYFSIKSCGVVRWVAQLLLHFLHKHSINNTFLTSELIRDLKSSNELTFPLLQALTYSVYPGNILNSSKSTNFACPIVALDCETIDQLLTKYLKAELLDTKTESHICHIQQKKPISLILQNGYFCHSQTNFHHFGHRLH